MYIDFSNAACDSELQACAVMAQAHGHQTAIIKDADRTRLVLFGRASCDDSFVDTLRRQPGVTRIEAAQTPFILCGRQARQNRTVVDVGGVEIGGHRIVIMAGPCAVEDEDQVMTMARHAQEAGAKFLRGGAFKPRTSPYDFQGWGERGLKYLAKARDAYGLKMVTEVLSEHSVAMVSHYADVLQIGTRNMQNFALLQAVGRQNKPVLLKRGLCATYREWLFAAEYIAAAGNPNIILCERGIRTFETATRNTLDMAAVPVMKTLTHLPVVIDPSHASGRRDCILALSQGAVAAGADGLLIEAHPQPDKAWSDGAQSLDPVALAQLAHAIGRVAPAVDRAFP